VTGFFSRIAAALNDPYKEQCTAKRDFNIPLQRDNKPLPPLRKGQQVQSKSGRKFTVKEFDDNWVWTEDLSLPWLRKELMVC